VNRRVERRLRGDLGSAAIEACVAVTALLGMLFLTVGGLRLVGASGDVKAAARQAARAAAVEYDLGAADAAARHVAAVALADRGVACEDLSVSVAGDLNPGGVIAVEVSCTVSLADVALGGFGAGSRTLRGRGVETVDVIRGGVP
jgi:Flp pilus assembly protein TadG